MSPAFLSPRSDAPRYKRVKAFDFQRNRAVGVVVKTMAPYIYVLARSIEGNQAGRLSRILDGTE